MLPRAGTQDGNRAGRESSSLTRTTIEPANGGVVDGRVVDDLRATALRALRHTFLPDRARFAFTLRGGPDGLASEGESRRYTAIALIGLACVGDDDRAAVCHGAQVGDVCRRLLADVSRVENLGDAALTLWAAVAHGDSQAAVARDRIYALRPWEGAFPTVEIAWALTALSLAATRMDSDATAATRVADRLCGMFHYDSGMFPHGPTRKRGSGLRSHITCFADLVYPMQALSHFFRWTRREPDLSAARRCAERTCALQGPSGQWWWHYDVRTGRVVEPYPVYAVHQHAMGPMALFAVAEAGGGSYQDAVYRGLDWLRHPPELSRSLIDHEAGVIWRKVARYGPPKMARTVQALASRMHPALRVPGLGTVLRPGKVDYECRPYEFGWLLYAWSDQGGRK